PRTPRSRNVAPSDSTCSFTTGRTSKPETTAPSRRAVAIACRPATPAPRTSTFAGGTVPAAVVSIGKNFGRRYAASSTAVTHGAGERQEHADQHVAVAEPLGLLGARLLHLGDRLGPAPDRVDEGRARLCEHRVFVGSGLARAPLDQDLEAALCEPGDDLRDERHSAFVRRGLLRNADVHEGQLYPAR